MASKYELIHSFTDSKKGYYSDEFGSKMTVLVDGVDLVQGYSGNYDWYIDDRKVSKEEARVAYKIRTTKLYRSVYGE